ncbi:MAG TPA: DUF4446 family protein [Mycobacteriales bacterium]|nr:DUF4446 family protein [Mycobacteriales bacterium]
MLTHRVFEAVAVTGVALGLLGLVTALLALRALARTRRSLLLLHRDGDQPSFLEAAGRTVTNVATLREETATLRAETAAVREELAHAVRRVALVRYDAFPDVGGRMSFSVALLADDRNGVVLTAINGRHETRMYAKRIVGGTAEQDISPEEREAIAEALGTGPVARQPVARRR